jgi:hypothetical protein
MKNLCLTTLVAGVLASAALGLAGPAAAESRGSTSVGSTISKLAANGYRVTVSRVGSAPIDQCTVSQVRPGSTFSRTVPGLGDEGVSMVTSKTVYLDVVC